MNYYEKINQKEVNEMVNILSSEITKKFPFDEIISIGIKVFDVNTNYIKFQLEVNNELEFDVQDYIQFPLNNGYYVITLHCLEYLLLKGLNSLNFYNSELEKNYIIEDIYIIQ